MMFVDGENLAKRFQSLREGRHVGEHVRHRADVYVWSEYASRRGGPCEFIRRYYYTSAGGDRDEHERIANELRDLGIEAPRVFPRKQKGRSKRVDITLATDMLTHAHRGNYDLAVLVAGDGDYVPLVEAVQGEGKRVALWFVDDGLNPALRAAADHYWDLGELLFNDRTTQPAFSLMY